MGIAAPGHRFWSQPRPWIQPSGGAPRRTRSTTSSIDRAPRRSTSTSAEPSPARWACASVRPGTALPPARSTTCPRGQSRASDSAAAPRAITRPSTAASARVIGSAGSPVQIVPPRTTSRPFPWSGGQVAGELRPPVRHAISADAPTSQLRRLK
ncbi:hypothetical protein OV079_26000 [Nannocystis pusilla]|uniref:Uncharacterized protein n=1 Tax=Nannocystis pusilla TaxID=889268 RepID=A0A9X3ERT6_9BACT|nr:hypothetical protein [Nannocystis pusilla]MCY1008947.1 hypothetical protein [Nannocystis pusilla]